MPTHLDGASLPPVIASRNARSIWNRAASEYVHVQIASDSRSTMGGNGDVYVQRLNFLAAMTWGPPKWSRMISFGLFEPAQGYEADPYGTLEIRSWGVCKPNASGYDTLQAKSKSAPGFAARALDYADGNEPYVVITPEPVMAHMSLHAHNAVIVNRSTSLNVQLNAYAFTGPVTHVDTYSGSRQVTFQRGYCVKASRTATFPGYIEDTKVAVTGYDDVTTAFDFNGTTEFAPCSWTGAVPFKPDTTGFPSFKLYSLAAQGPVCNTWGWRYQDPTSTTGMSFTSISEGGYDFTSIPTLHGSCQPTLQSMASVADTVIVLMGYGVNDAVTSGHTTATMYTDAMAFIAWMKSCHSTVKRLLFVYEGYTTRLDDGLTVNGLSFATRLANYRKLPHVLAQACMDSAVEFIVVNGVKAMDRRGYTAANEAAFTLTGTLWAAATAYTAGQVVAIIPRGATTVTTGSAVRYFQAVVDNTGKDPLNEYYRGCWVEVKQLLGGATIAGTSGNYAEAVHPQVEGQIIRADLLWSAIGGPHYSLDATGAVSTLLPYTVTAPDRPVTALLPRA